jgi:hypothetical protein
MESHVAVSLEASFKAKWQLWNKPALPVSVIAR